MRVVLTALIVALFAMSALAPSYVLADQKPGGNPESPSNDNQGAGNDPPGGAGGAAPGQTTNPNPAK